MTNDLETTLNTTEIIDRPPRIQPPLPHEEIPILPPPNKDQRKQSALQLLLPLITVIGYVLVSAGGGGRNILFIIPMGLTMVGTAGFAIYNMYQERKELDALIEAYDLRLRTLRNDLEHYHDMQYQFYEHNYPGSDVCVAIGLGTEVTRLGHRLWERRAFDFDFGMIRIGTGDIPSSVQYTLSQGDSNTEDPQMDEAIQLAEDSLTLVDAPVVISLRGGPSQNEDDNSNKNGTQVSTRHSIGVSGNPINVSDLANSIAVQYATFHPPHEARLFVIGASHAKSRWDWAQWLPHTNSSPSNYVGDQMCFYDLPTESEIMPDTEVTSASDETEILPSDFWKALARELENRRVQLNEGEDEKSDTKPLPHLLVIVDNLSPDVSDYASRETSQWLDDAVNEQAVSLILAEGSRLGASIIFLVPQNSKIPTDCKSVIELNSRGESLSYRYSEVGRNTTRYMGSVEHVSRVQARDFAIAIRNKTVRLGYGADLPSNLSILDLFRVNTIQDLRIASRWKDRREFMPKPDWLKSLIGSMSGEEQRELYFQQDHDGVHGIIAGTTGSGKSELLLTLIASMAINYDPSLVNFVLIDYKGGTAFEPFRGLPHVVDIVTNLEGNAVDRVFQAVKSEIDRRNRLLKDNDCKHIVEYQQLGYHQDPSPTRGPFPFLFIVVDEFAEMVQENPEFKAQFNSITRLGRAPGVSLILATQRPTGIVTDQMRANMKFRICLRVETTDDSREMLGRSDARFLPSGIPGRAYVQVGSDTPTLIQVARAGGEYVEPADDDIQEQDIRWSWDFLPDENKTSQDKNPSIVRMVVEHCRTLSEDDEKVAKQYKPWPDALPRFLPLNHEVDAKHLEIESSKKNQADETIILNKAVKFLMTNRKPSKPWQEGRGVYWTTDDNQVADAGMTTIGLIDFPGRAKQYPLTIDLKKGPIVAMGAGGYGKTLFLSSLVLGLMAFHSPAELQIYPVDFGRGGLNHLSGFPHMSAAIEVGEDARIERLLRVIASEIKRRQPLFRETGSIHSYNQMIVNEAQGDTDKLAQVEPMMLIIIDNFAEFRDSYEQHMEQLISLVRSGRALGIYFVITADQFNAVPSKLMGLFTQRYSFKMIDDGDYQTILGRGGRLPDIPGRGLVLHDRVPCEFHLGLPLTHDFDEEIARTQVDEFRNTLNKTFADLASIMTEHWDKTRGEPHSIDQLSLVVDIRPLVTQYAPDHNRLRSTARNPLGIPIGIYDIDRKPAVIDIGLKGPHFLVLGEQLSGKTTLLQSMTMGLAEHYTPKDVAFVLVDPKQTLFDYGGQHSLADLPHVLQTVGTGDEFHDMMKRFSAEFDETIQQTLREKSTEGHNLFVSETPLYKSRHIVIVIDNYDDIKDFKSSRELNQLADMAYEFRDKQLHIVLCGTTDIAKANISDELFRRVKNSRYSVHIQNFDLVNSIPYRMVNVEMPPGRGFIEKGREALLAQFGTVNTTIAYASEDQEVNLLDMWVQDVIDKHKSELPAHWYFRGAVQSYDKTLHESNGKVADVKEVEIQDEEVSATMKNRYNVNFDE